MNIQSNFGDALKSLRTTLGLSQLALATRLSSTQRHLSFLETGRSQPRPEFLRRLCTELSLNGAQRSALFESSGFHNPFPRRALTSDEVAETLDMISRRILGNWPFPAFVLSQDWSVLRLNTPAQKMFSAFGVDAANARPNMLAFLLSPSFRSLIRNWEVASQGLYFRLLAASEHNPDIRQMFETARKEGVFDHIPSMLTRQDDTPIYIPFEIGPPGGPVLRMTSFVGKLGTVQDSFVESLEVELMVPLDDASEERILAQSNS